MQNLLSQQIKHLANLQRGIFKLCKFSVEQELAILELAKLSILNRAKPGSKLVYLDNGQLTRGQVADCDSLGVFVGQKHIAINDIYYFI